MTTKRGRKSIYESIILPNLDKIEEWTKNGATEKQICEALNISVSAYNEHKKKNELKEAIKKGRTHLILDLKGELVRIAKKHSLETKKQYIRVDEVTGNKTQYTEITTKEVDGDTAAIHLLLKNLDREQWKNDWDNYEFKKMEIELRQKLADQKDEEW